VEVSGRRMKLRDYIDSLRHIDSDAVFSKEDPLPGIVEFLLLPYLLMKRGY